MKRLPKILMILAPLMLLTLFLFPLWSIKLEAPQYPKGITMYIWINKITGDTESTVQNINILNHYIGMKYIDQDSIPELKYFPMVILGLVATGLLAAFSNKKSIWLTWGILLIILGGLGIYDFYLWEYDYGHNLDPRAPIKIEGQVYQPPLIGSKWLLNFKATSLPYIGGVFLFLSMVFPLVAWWLSKTSTRKAGQLAMAAMMLLPMTLLSSCSTDPIPIAYGEDDCSYCRMKIMDARYGAELVTEKGKVFKFDAVECMIHYTAEQKTDLARSPHLLSADFASPGHLQAASQTVFLRSPDLPSPMGMYITSFADKSAAEAAQETHGGNLYSWEELMADFNRLPTFSQTGAEEQ